MVLKMHNDMWLRGQGVVVGSPCGQLVGRGRRHCDTYAITQPSPSGIAS
jgi:hypothetical protein